MSDRSRAPEVSRPFHGVRAVGLGDDLASRCRAFAPLLTPGAFFSHTTASGLWTGISVDDRVHVSVLFPRSPPRGRGVVGHSIQRIGWLERDGLRLAPPAAAWRQSAGIVDTPTLVVLGDALVGSPRRPGHRAAPLTSIEDLARELSASAGSRGARTAAAALRLIRPGVGSPMETRLRLLLVGFGLPEPAVDHPVRIRPGRTWHPDLAYPDARIAIEYEGDGHRADRTRWQRDIERREAFEDAGWRVVRVTVADLRAPSPLLRRLRRLLATRADLPF